MHNKPPVFYSRSENRNGERELLSMHLNKTAFLAEKFAEVFNEGEAGRWCGLFHDLGKASQLFQDVLDGKEHGVMHESAGAFFAIKNLPFIIGLVIYAHHKGLVFGIERNLEKTLVEKDSYDSYSGRRFSVSGKDQYKIVKQFVDEELDLPRNKPELLYDIDSYYKNLSFMLHTRVLLSCLVDADYTASASHNEESILDSVDGELLNADRILDNLARYREGIIKQSKANGHVNLLRNIVFKSCAEAAVHEPGMFTLTAPTGTGKTLALLEFAARHAAKYNKRRIIIVLPFLSIISQNAKIYRDICGDVLEAHSMVSYDEKTRLLSERWNSPVIVTTSVKFFEAFFKSKPSDLRFLHSITDSVIVFDEAQSVPDDLVGTTMETLRVMCEMFKCSVLLSTATQPDFSVRKDIAVRSYEIIQDVYDLYRQATRVDVEWMINNRTSFEDVAAEMISKRNACCVVNRKDHAFKLFEILSSLNETDCFHISTDMCKEHRDLVIKEVTNRLKNKQPCYLVSTSCIEAGVDLDFGCMFRTLAPLDSIIQCAGRCNRNGETGGKMFVFIPEEDKLYPTERYARAAEIVKLIASRHPIDINNPKHISEYYFELFEKYKKDKVLLEKAISEYDFEEVENQYRFIPSVGANVLVPYEICRELFDDLAEEVRKKGLSKDWMRRAAPITVSSFRIDKLEELCEKCFICTQYGKEQVEGWYILNDDKFYDKNTGLRLNDDSSIDFLI